MRACDLNAHASESAMVLLYANLLLMICMWLYYTTYANTCVRNRALIYCDCEVCVWVSKAFKDAGSEK